VRNKKVVRLFLRAFGYMRPYSRLAVASVSLMLLTVAVDLLLPWPIKYIVDHVLNDVPMPPRVAAAIAPLVGYKPGQLILFATLGFVLVLAHNVLAVLTSYVNTTIEQSVCLDFRSHLCRHVMALSMAAHDQRRSGMLIYAVNSMCDGVPRVVMAVPPLVQNALTLVGMFCVLLFINVYLALVSVAIVPLLYLAIWYYVRHIQPRLYRVKALEGESLAIIHEALSMMRVIVAFGREGHEYGRFRRQGETAIKERIELTVRQTGFNLSVNLITAAGTAVVVGVGAIQALRGELSVGQLLVVLAYIAALYRPLEAISTTIGSLQDVFINLDLTFGILDQPVDIKDAPGAVAIARARGHVAYDRVGFSYTGRTDTLRDVSFEARPGQVVAIVGPTGAGKTTLVSLLPRLYDSVHGRITLDGRDVKGLTLASLRAQISVVLQEPLLFSGSIADNIRYGRLEASMDEVIEAARSANAHDFIVRLPQGYDTELGERGAKLSGGERQRIAVARAFLKDAPILILDEPTSSIDSKTEAVILDALDRLMEGRTTFMIAHRLSTIRRADQILVVDHGRVVEQGTHEELLALDGMYKQLHDLQNRYTRARRRL
jgi:ABC-type multidrug transport system fused ATPase/permease subunit